MFEGSTGVILKKPTPKLFSANLNHFEDAIGWVRRYLARHGYVVNVARLDPYVEVWFFYEDDTLVLILGHDDVGRIAEGLYKRTAPRVDSLWKLGQEPRDKNGRLTS